MLNNCVMSFKQWSAFQCVLNDLYDLHVLAATQDADECMAELSKALDHLERAKELIDVAMGSDGASLDSVWREQGIEITDSNDLNF